MIILIQNAGRSCGVLDVTRLPSTNAFKMALYAFIIGKYQDTTEKETIKQRISSVFGDAVLNA